MPLPGSRFPVSPAGTPAGLTGKTCANNVDECSSSPCASDGICFEGVDSYECLCTWLWTGDNCAEEHTENVALGIVVDTELEALTYLHCSPSFPTSDGSAGSEFRGRRFMQYVPATDGGNSSCACPSGFEPTVQEEGSEFAVWTCVALDHCASSPCGVEGEEMSTGRCMVDETGMAVYTGYKCEVSFYNIRLI